MWFSFEVWLHHSTRLLNSYHLLSLACMVVFSLSCMVLLSALLDSGGFFFIHHNYDNHVHVQSCGWYWKYRKD